VILIDYLLLEELLMSNILNPKPRFGYNPDSGLIYDYVAQKDVPATPNYAGVDGAWNLLEVKRAIMANETIEFARLTVIKPAPKPQPKPAVPVAPLAPVPGQAAPTTVKSGLQPTTGASAHPTMGATPAGAMSVAELQALKLSPLQAAAMGITPAQMNVTGVTALQVANWGLTPARADALKFTKEQRLDLKIP
jgi:hypothetical protein